MSSDRSRREPSETSDGLKVQFGKSIEVDDCALVMMVVRSQKFEDALVATGMSIHAKSSFLRIPCQKHFDLTFSDFIINNHIVDVLHPFVIVTSAILAFQR